MPTIAELQNREREIRDASLRIYRAVLDEVDALVREGGMKRADALNLERDALTEAAGLIERRLQSEGK